MSKQLNLQVGDVIATTEETWDIPVGSEGVVTRVITGGIGLMLAVDFEDIGSRVIRPGVARFVERPPDLCADWDTNAYALRIAAERRAFVPMIVNVHADPGA